MYAIIETGGKQYKVAVGDKIYVEKLDCEVEKPYVFENVLAVSNEGEMAIGSPYVSGASVDATVVKHGKAKKVLMMKYRPKKDLHKKRGHRQNYTLVEIKSIKA